MLIVWRYYVDRRIFDLSSEGVFDNYVVRYSNNRKICLYGREILGYVLTEFENGLFWEKNKILECDVGNFKNYRVKQKSTKIMIYSENSEEIVLKLEVPRIYDINKMMLYVIQSLSDFGIKGFVALRLHMKTKYDKLS